MGIIRSRKPHYKIDPVFISRRSVRAFSGEHVPDEVLLSAVEAARWAPSGGNAQPWRFVYAKRDSVHWTPFLSLLNERNQRWSAKASALVVLLSHRFRDSEKGLRPSHSHSFDAGAAWSNFAHQAHLLGWSAVAMGGFDRDAARALLQVPDEYAIEVVIAVGKPDEAKVLPGDLKVSEQVSDRLPISALLAEGRFGFAYTRSS